MDLSVTLPDPVWLIIGAIYAVGFVVGMTVIIRDLMRDD